VNGQLLDTTVLIDLSRGNTAAADFVDEAFNSGSPLFISVISAMELIAGCRNKAEVKKAEKLVADFSLVHLSPIASAKAYALMLAFSKSHGLVIPDALIAATAITEGLELATDNDRHFKMISDLTAKRPY
jgi:predicted nucleic acid-binding protein